MLLWRNLSFTLLCRIVLIQPNRMNVKHEKPVQGHPVASQWALSPNLDWVSLTVLSHSEVYVQQHNQRIYERIVTN